MQMDYDGNNGLLAKMHADDFAALFEHLEWVQLQQGQVLFRSYEIINHVYFFESGLSSEIAGPEGGVSIEVGCIGYEGLSGSPVLLEVDSSPHYAFMQVGGTAHRIETDALKKLMEARPSMRRILLRFAHVFTIQIAASALANSRFGVEKRLARWLLMCQDRLGKSLPLTHDFFALMLGVRRPSVTDALHRLEGKLLIRSERSLVTVRNRSGLEDLAGSAYGLPESEYHRLIANF